MWADPETVLDYPKNKETNQIYRYDTIGMLISRFAENCLEKLP